MTSSEETAAHDRLQTTLDSYRPFGFLTQFASGAELFAAVQQRWGLDLEDYTENEQSELDEMALCCDTERVFEAAGDGYRPNENAYDELLKGCAGISNGAFTPQGIQEDWADFDTVTVRWSSNGSDYTYEPVAKYIDSNILSVINEGVTGPNRFIASDGLGMPRTILFVTNELAAQLQSDVGLSVCLPSLPRHAPPAVPVTDDNQKPRRSGLKRLFGNRRSD